MTSCSPSTESEARCVCPAIQHVNHAKGGLYWYTNTRYDRFEMVAQRLVYEDGVGIAACGDVMIIYFFDTPTVAHMKRVEAFATALIEELGDTIVYSQVIADGHPLPSREAQSWTVEMGGRLIPHLRGIVAFPKGDSFRSIAIRSVLRMVGMLIRTRQRIVDSEPEFLDAILEQRSAHTPTRREITVVVRELEAARRGAQQPAQRVSNG